MTRIDLHTHSTFSDGLQSPEELVSVAKNNRISYLSLTDHDTVSGLDSAESAAAAADIHFIPGIEVSAKFEGGTLHILGYGIDRESPEILRKLALMQQHRNTRNSRIIEKLRDMGFDITVDEVKATVGDNTVIGRPHIANVMLQKKLAPTFHDIFDRFLGEGKPAYVSKEIFDSAEVIALLKAAGCLVTVAHPITLNLTDDSLKQVIADMKEQGLDGLEVYNSRHSKTFRAELLELTDKLDLIVSGGSDYHGRTDSNVKIGQDYYGRWISKDQLSPALFN